ncbi:adenylate cyclase [Bosea caraganae]|uniref:Adenylate cyclase n=1 Tax=Bosea caraganae TaxID=2763117 RepID=A0A370LBK1_9HYPH|nr:adenylate cyclase [Bosea caraganae]RDJ27255.1 adenylate cyclase [Bosea caraganae]RDJ29271.1 adenylate cyclase [Bosea caraganae]
MASAKPDTRAAEAADAAPPSSNEVLAQLDRILSSQEFSLPERGRKFLQYIVDETLAGGADRIKGYSIALNVFGRAVSFDAQSDPVVRIEAGRLRRALERYYLVAGQCDPIRIDIPKGGYVPVFTRVAVLPAVEIEPHDAQAQQPIPALADAGARHSGWRPRLMFGLAVIVLVPWMYLAASFLWPSAANNAASPSAPEKPKLLVLPFRDTSETAEGKVYAAGFADEIINQLSAFKELTVLGHETSRSLGTELDIGRIRDEMGVGYVIQGSVRISGAQSRVTARAIETKTQAVLWSHTFGDDFATRDLINVQDEIARQVARAVAQPYGIVFQADLPSTQRRVPDDLEAYLCTLRFYGYRAELSVAQHATVRACLERATARWPHFATAWAMLSHVYLDEDRFGFNTQPETGVTRSLDAARKAVSLEPDNIRALQSLMLALFFDRRAKEALSVGERAILLNPNDAELRGEFGSRVAMAGDWKRGSELIEVALALNPGNSDYYRAVLALSAYMQKDFDRAAREIRQANLRNLPLFYVVAAIIYAESGLVSEAAQARDEFIRLRPTFFEHVDVELAKRNYRPEDQAVLIEGSRKAGFPVPARFLKPRD